ncbi:MAG: hypothetical protein ICV64_00240 [Thermoleophilia bacterium]|nr:hypothetical protein [Thermoleophilia bacterium]
MNASMSRLGTPSALVILTVVAAASLVGTLGADSRWVAALGRAIVDDGGIPDGVPYATAPSAGWPNVLGLAQVIFWAFEAGLGDRGLLLIHLAAVAFGLSLLAHSASRAGASEGATALVLAVVAAGALEHVVVVRLELFSLVLFPLLLALLHAEARAPSRRIWLLVPLVALWGNLHGAVLAGLAVAGAYLLLERGRQEPLTALGVLTGSATALLLNPALHRAPEYYVGVLRSEAARRGFGLWEAISLTSPFDVVFLAGAGVLLVFALRARPAVWEAVAITGLAMLTAKAARSGVWLAFGLAVPAARGFHLPGMVRRRIVWTALAVAAAAAAVGLATGPIATGVDDAMLRDTLKRARGTPVLAEPLAAEQLALAGGRVWIANPLDAFSLRHQRIYLDWLQGRRAGDRALALTPRVVLVDAGGPAAERIARDRSFVEVRREDGAALYVRRQPAG